MDLARKARQLSKKRPSRAKSEQQVSMLALCEVRTHDLQIMRLTLCQLS